MTLQSIWLGIDLDSWLKIASLLGTFFVWLLERRRIPRLQAFFTHGAAHQIPVPQGQTVHLNTHTLQVRNAGHASARNVRITHAHFPPHTAIQVWPVIPYATAPNPPTGNELLFERLRPNEQLSISYIYPGGTTFDQFGTSVRFDDGFGEFFPIQHARLIPRWGRLMVYYLLFAGLALTIYIGLKTFLFFFTLI